jgi:hypothetical protein
MIYESKMFVYITNCNIEWFEALFEKTDEHACDRVTKNFTRKHFPLKAILKIKIIIP